MTGEITTAGAGADLVAYRAADNYLGQIRPYWQGKNLITRVKRLLSVDPSSACQRVFNAAIHDLREKILVAGLDIAQEASRQHRLPPVQDAESLEQYPTARVIDLAYRIGLLSRPEWRRLWRAYDIRRDLEHEDDEYEAQPEDVFYMFASSIDIVLSRDPIEVVRVVDIKELIEQPGAAAPSAKLLDDYRAAHAVRQSEILGYMTSVALDERQPEIVRANCFNLLTALEPLTGNQAKIELAKNIQGKVGRGRLKHELARVAFAAGAFPYLNQTTLAEFFGAADRQFSRVSYRWTEHREHAEPLQQLLEVGGLQHCPVQIRARILRWLVLAYVGEPGGYGVWGSNRKVFFSNVAAPLIQQILCDARSLVRGEAETILASEELVSATTNPHVKARAERLLGFVSEE